MKFKSVFLFVAAIAFFAAYPSSGGVRALEVKEKSVAGTENTNGLTDKQLAVQRWFAYLTYLNDGEEGWGGWYHDEKQLGLDSYRYSLAFMGYAAGAMAYKTPAYTELTGNILDNAIRKMIETRVWDFIKTYWEEEPTFPDPVAWENIMYSGHLMQLIALYESLTGDMKYSTDGWDFVYEDTVIHYTADKLMQVVYDQVELDETGGVPCEPDTIFVICNDHPQIAFLLYDAIHGTKYASLADKWRGWMEANAPLPVVKGKDFLKISYLRDRKTWTTGFGTPGSDGWALAWMYPWSGNLDFVCDGWLAMAKNKLWTNKDGEGMFLRATAVSAMFGVDDSTGTSFYPLVEVQCNDTNKSRAESVYEHFENLYGTFTDIDGDGMKDSYYYETELKSRLWVTANLVTAMVTKGDSLRSMYRNPFFMEHAGEPFLKHADYPKVWVKKAQYDPASGTLAFTVLPGTAKPAGETALACGNAGKAKSVTMNGKPFSGYRVKDREMILTVALKGETEFVVTF